MTDDVIHSTQYHIKYKNRAISANLQRRPLKLGRLMVLQEHTYGYKNSVPKATHSFSVPTYLISTS